MEFLKKLYIRTCGYSYTNLGRLFLRLFVGLMLLQFGVRQSLHYSSAVVDFPSVLGMEPSVGLTLFIIIEIVCSLFLMFGFLTRLMTIPPIVAMAIAAVHLLGDYGTMTYLIDWRQPAYLPVLFLGYYIFILIVGPGKISVDYFLSLHLIHTADQSEEEELEEV